MHTVYVYDTHWPDSRPVWKCLRSRWRQQPYTGIRSVIESIFQESIAEGLEGRKRLISPTPQIDFCLALSQVPIHPC